MVKQFLEEGSVDAYWDALDLVQVLCSKGFELAVDASSTNCKAVLESVVIDHLFDVRVDGVVATRLQLPGKPSPETSLKAAELLAVVPRSDSRSQRA